MIFEWRHWLRIPKERRKFHIISLDYLKHTRGKGIKYCLLHEKMKTKETFTQIEKGKKIQNDSLEKKVLFKRVCV